MSKAADRFSREQNKEPIKDVFKGPITSQREADGVLLKILTTKTLHLIKSIKNIENEDSNLSWAISNVEKFIKKYKIESFY